MGRQLDYLIKYVYEGTDLETLREDYKPFDIENINDMIFHLLAKNCAGKPSTKLAKALREFRWATQKTADFLEHFVRKNRKIAKEEFEKYSCQKDMQVGIALSEKKSTHKEFDDSYLFGGYIKYAGKFAFCVLYKNKLAGYITFNPVGEKILVPQIQGVKKHRNEYKPLNQFLWSLALLSRIVNFSRENNIPEVEIVSVANNRWSRLTFETLKQGKLYSPSTTIEDAARMSAEEENEIREKARKHPTIYYGGIHLMPHQGFLLYDVTAKKLGFEKAENGNYVLKTA